MGCSGTSHNMKMATIPPKDTQVAEEVIDNFGYFDEVKYYYNGCRYRYSDGYLYQDRLYRRGKFDPKVRHIRVCEEDYDRGDGYYYPTRGGSRVKKGRVAHPEYLEERFIGSGGYSRLLRNFRILKKPFNYLVYSNPLDKVSFFLKL